MNAIFQRPQMILLTMALVAAALASSLVVLWLTMVVLGAGIGLLLPGNLAAMSLIAGRHRQGRLAGANGVGMGLGMALGPVVGAVMHQWHYSGPYWLAAALCLLITVTASRVASGRRELLAGGASA